MGNSVICDKSNCRLLEQRTTTREDQDVGDFVPEYICDSRGILKQFSLRWRKFSGEAHQLVTNWNIRLYEQCHSQLYGQVPDIERHGNSREQGGIPYENNHSHCLVHV